MMQWTWASVAWHNISFWNIPDSEPEILMLSLHSGGVDLTLQHRNCFHRLPGLIWQQRNQRNPTPSVFVLYRKWPFRQSHRFAHNISGQRWRIHCSLYLIVLNFASPHKFYCGCCQLSGQLSINSSIFHLLETSNRSPRSLKHRPVSTVSH